MAGKEKEWKEEHSSLDTEPEPLSILRHLFFAPLYDARRTIMILQYCAAIEMRWKLDFCIDSTQHTAQRCLNMY